VDLKGLELKILLNKNDQKNIPKNWKRRKWDTTFFKTPLLDFQYLLDDTTSKTESKLLNIFNLTHETHYKELSELIEASFKRPINESFYEHLEVEVGVNMYAFISFEGLKDPLILGTFTLIRYQTTLLLHSLGGRLKDDTLYRAYAGKDRMKLLCEAVKIECLRLQKNSPQIVDLKFSCSKDKVIPKYLENGFKQDLEAYGIIVSD
jgi:hypothetical protein